MGRKANFDTSCTNGSHGVHTTLRKLRRRAAANRELAGTGCLRRQATSPPPSSIRTTLADRRFRLLPLLHRSYLRHLRFRFGATQPPLGCRLLLHRIIRLRAHRHLHIYHRHQNHRLAHHRRRRRGFSRLQFHCHQIHHQPLPGQGSPAPLRPYISDQKLTPPTPIATCLHHFVFQLLTKYRNQLPRLHPSLFRLQFQPHRHLRQLLPNLLS